MSQKLLKNCSILDVIGKRVLQGRSILIEGSQIKKIGGMEESGTLEKGLPKGSVFELEGKLVMPGLIDSHVHLSVIQGSSESVTLLENLRATETLKVLYGAKHARETLEAGFTTVRDMGEGDNLALKDAIERGVISGPRIVACGRLGMTGGHQERMSSEWAYNVPIREGDVGVDGPWEIRKKVRKLTGKGVDFIKTFATGGGCIKHPFYPYWLDGRNYTQEELGALVDEAHSAGRRVAAQVLVSPEGVKSAIRAGVDTIEHGVCLDEEDIDEMRRKGIFYVPTLGVIKGMWDIGEGEEIKSLQVEKSDAKRYLEAHQASFRRARDKGVKIAMGSDTFRVLKQGENACELEWLVKAGMSMMEALVSATKIASEALGIDSLVGSVEEGKWADLLVVDPSPLNNILVLRDRGNLKMIMKNGDVICSRL